MNPEDDTQVTLSLASLQGLVDEIKRLRAPAPAPVERACEHKWIVSDDKTVRHCYFCMVVEPAPACAARSLHAQGGVSEAMREVGRLPDVISHEEPMTQKIAFTFLTPELARAWLKSLYALAEETRTLSSGASVVVDREARPAGSAPSPYPPTYSDKQAAAATAERERDEARDRLRESAARVVRLDGELHAAAAKLAKAEKNDTATRAALGLHTDPADCIGCGCMMATTPEQAATVLREAECEKAARIEAVKNLAESVKQRDAARAEAERLRGEVRLAEAVSAVHEANAAPTVAVTDVERAAMTVVKKFGLGDGSLASEQSTSEEIAAILRDCTRAASVEEVAKAVYETEDWVPTPSEVRETVSEGIAHAILRALGVREAEKNATPFVVDREKVACAIAATTFSDLKPFSKPEWDKKDPRYRRYRVEEADAAITEYERQRAEHEKGGAA